MLTDDELIAQAWPSVIEAAIASARRGDVDEVWRSMAGRVLQLERELERLRNLPVALVNLANEWNREATANAGPPSDREHDYLDPGNVADHRSAGYTDGLDECADRLHSLALDAMARAHEDGTER